MSDLNSDEARTACHRRASGPVKAMILSLDAGSLRGRLEELLESKNTSLREDLKRFAAEKGVQI